MHVIFIVFLPESETYSKIAQQIVELRLICSAGFSLGI